MRIDKKFVQAAMEAALDEGYRYGTYDYLSFVVARLGGDINCIQARKFVHGLIESAEKEASLSSECPVCNAGECTKKASQSPFMVRIQYKVKGRDAVAYETPKVVSRIFKLFEDIIVKDLVPDYRVMVSILYSGAYEASAITVEPDSIVALDEICLPLMGSREEYLLKDLFIMKEASRRIKGHIKALNLGEGTRDMVDQIAMSAATRVVSA